MPPPLQADEAVRVKREQAAAAEEADAARWAEYGRREAAARADVKREVAGRREREAQDGAAASSADFLGADSGPVRLGASNRGNDGEGGCC